MGVKRSRTWRMELRRRCGGLDLFQEDWSSVAQKDENHGKVSG